jgi:membrane fusion protein, multidrug efflux system
MRRPFESSGRAIVWVMVLTVVCLVSIGLAAHHLVQSSQVDARLVGAPIPLQTVAARVQSLDDEIGGSGSIQPSEPITITGKVVARVLHVTVEEGEIVHPGDLLVDFDPQLYDANLASAEATYEHAHKQLERMEALARKQFAAPVDVENARVAEAQTRDTVVSAKIDLSNTKVYSPVAAIVLSRTVNPGEMSRMDETMLQLGILDPVLMNAAVSEDKLGFTFIGMPGEVGTDAFPGEVFKGKVTRIDPTVDPTTRTFGAYIQIANHDLRLKSGVTGYARLTSHRMVVVVPSTAIMNPVGDRSSVFVVDSDGTAHLREVRVGMTANGATEILSGVQEGEQVVVAGQMGLRDNDKVRANQNAPWNKS